LLSLPGVYILSPMLAIIAEMPARALLLLVSLLSLLSIIADAPRALLT
jgi:hypothetical protein